MAPPNLPHDEIEELVAADALGGLDELDRRRLERELQSHGHDCEECGRLISEYSEVAAELAMSVDPLPPSTRAEEELIRRALAPEEGGRATGRRPAPRWMAAVAVAAVVAVLGGLVGYRIASGAGSGAPSRAFLTFLSAPGTRVIPFPQRDGQRLAVALHPGESGGWVLGAGLPSLENGRVYELWYLPEASGTMQPAGTFVPSEGRVVSPVTVAPAFVTLAVSVEPRGGSTAPTTQPIFVTNVKTTF